MHADVERFSHDPAKRFLRVIQQQGRVALAADGNEQAAILLDYLRELAVDVIGDFGTPANPANTKPGEGFRITRQEGRMGIAPGRFWVDGLPCTNDDEALSYGAQADYPQSPDLPERGRFVVYLDVWERHISAAQDPSIREVALGGPDTCTRAHLVWQVKAAQVDESNTALTTSKQAVQLWHKNWHPRLDIPWRGRMAVEVDRDGGPPDPCQAPEGAGYFGRENQLYRVEVHRGGAIGGAAPPTFKWSRDNGSVVYPLAAIEGTTATLLDPPLDCTKQLVTGTLVEVVDDVTALHATPGVLARVVDVEDDGDDVVVHLSAGPAGVIDAGLHPMLRRWDHPLGEGLDEYAVVEGGSDPVALEDGIGVRFAAPDGGAPTHVYRTGDYWTFPARAALGDVVWPRAADGSPEFVGPQGIDHHMAPLAVVNADEADDTAAVLDCRVGFARLATLFP
ncbi:MAG: hypothetical protein QOI20_2879 [Acidimicrobiaceae bacterium]|nr:hypothetical protein [Acidimicrobiaceae bacterium]